MALRSLFGAFIACVGVHADYHQNAGVLRYVNPKIGTSGIAPNQNGGMIPSVGIPFGMTRWTAQTRENFISQCPYNELDGHLHGFQATHQPAIWMGESGQVVLSPGVGQVRPLFENRAHAFLKADESATPYVYEIKFDSSYVDADHSATESLYSPVPGGQQPVPDSVKQGANGRTRRDLTASTQAVLPASSTAPARHTNGKSIQAAMTASGHVGHLRLDFEHSDLQPHIFVQVTRKNWTGHVVIDSSQREIFGSNPQRQDYALGPSRAASFRGYFVSRFSQPFESFGTANGANITEGATNGTGEVLGAFARFPSGTQRVEVRTAVSFVSVEQARRNLDIEASNEMSFDHVVEATKQAWLEKLSRVTIEGVNETDSQHDPRVIWYTSLFHGLQYPNDYSEPLDKAGDRRTYYSGYTDSVHESNDHYFQSWSIWDTFRAQTSLISMFAPDKVNGMMNSLLKIFDWSGRLPMWANVVETNIVVGTHVDAILANALARGFKGFNISHAWAAVAKNAFVPPINDTQYLYFDREGYTPDEVRAGLTTYGDRSKGYVANDRWSESASRTLDYAFDDYAASVVATHAGDYANVTFLLERSKNYKTIYNNATGFMEARNDNGTWAGDDQGWTEGDKHIYTLNVMHEPPGLASLMGGLPALKTYMDTYFSTQAQSAFSDFSNEPSHHSPYLYAVIGYPASVQKLVREIAWPNYNATSAGLSGNEDLGQTSAWYIFSAMGFYPLNPAGDEYVVGAPFFDRTTVRFPAGAATGDVGGMDKTVVISAPNASVWPYVRGLKVDGEAIVKPVLTHQQIVTADCIEFEMAESPQTWGMDVV